MEVIGPVFFYVQRLLRRLLVPAVMVSLVMGALPVRAQTVGGNHPIPPKFKGQVTAVQTSRDGTPLAFTLQVAHHPMDFQIVPQTKLVPRSAEATVEGFVAKDYAVVTARRVNHLWVAVRIDFDVQPLDAPPSPAITVTGTVVRESLTGKSFSMTLDTGDMRLVLITRLTRFRLDGQLLSGPAVLMKGDSVKVTMRRSGRSWVALEINLATPTPWF